ncbi:MAG: TolB family protein [Anaerolineae bacterium]
MRNGLAYILLLMMVLPITAQVVPESATSSWEVYITYDLDEAGMDRVQFINLLSGDVVSLAVSGERYTLLGAQVLYFDRITRQVMTAHPNGTVIPHPFIQLGAARRVDWVVSLDGRFIAWTLTYDNTNGLTTVTTVANPSGTNQNLVLSDGPRQDGVRVLPVAFTVDNTSIVLDSQPDGIGELTPYRQYANLFQLSLQDGTITPLPGEPSCFCAAALRARRLVRLAITSDFSGFDVAVYDMLNGESQTITSPGLTNYTQGGDILISPDGMHAVYALSQVDLTTPNSTPRTIIMLVNLDTLTQRQLSDPVDHYLKPVRWTEDNTAILFTDPDRNGTWKLYRETGELRRIADASFLGTLETD